MPGNAPKPPTPKALPAPDPGKRAPCPPDTLGVHARAVPGGVYRAALRPMLGDQLDKVPDPSAYAQAVIADMAPRDAAEEMLIAQLLFAHARVMRLTALANRQTEMESLRVVHEYADRASNTFRKLMLALAEYRRPTASATFTAIKQANFAGQQVIQNHENRNATNELGDTPHAPPALPTDTGGTSIPSFVRPAGEALDAIHRPTDARRQGPIADERDETR